MPSVVFTVLTTPLELSPDVRRAPLLDLLRVLPRAALRVLPLAVLRLVLRLLCLLRELGPFDFALAPFDDAALRVDLDDAALRVDLLLAAPLLLRLAGRVDLLGDLVAIPIPLVRKPLPESTTPLYTH